jgi:hypothetical protein
LLFASERFSLPPLVHALQNYSAGPFRLSLEECMSSKVTTLQAPPATDKAVRTASHPTEQQIASRAHQIFLERGATPGRDLDDWLQAERELKTAAAKPHNAPRPAAPSTAPLANPRFSR